MKIILGLALLCCLAVGQAEQTIGTSRKIASYTLVDEIIRALLEGLRKDVAALQIPDIEEKFTSELLNASLSAKQIAHENVENFEIVHLKSTLIPLRISNLTLHWKNAKGSALYDFDLNADLQEYNVTKYFGKGLASASLNDLTFTIGANLEQKHGAFQIKHGGLFGFDLRLGSATIGLESLMGSEELGQAIGQLVGDMLPAVIQESKDFLFNFFKDDIIEIINEALRSKNEVVSDASFESDEDLKELETFK